MNKVILKGRLGRELGKNWEFDIKTPKEAIAALNVNTDGRFSRYIIETLRSKNVSYVIYVGGVNASTPENRALLDGPCGKEEIHIVPTLHGAMGTEAFWINLLIQVAVAVALTFVSMALSPSPKVDLGSSDDAARRDSYLFSGGPQPAKQGKPVPVGYGRMIIYPTPISVQYIYNNKQLGVPPTKSPAEDSNPFQRGPGRGGSNQG